MPQIELFRWYIPDTRRKAGERLTSWRMTADQALKQYPTARPEPTSREVRDVPELERQGSGGLATVRAGGAAPRITGTLWQMMPTDNVASARYQLAQSWTAHPREPGRLVAPLGTDAGGQVIVSDWTWAVMHLMQLERQQAPR